MIEDFFTFYTAVILYQELTHFCIVEFLLYGESNCLGALITTGNLFFPLNFLQDLSLPLRLWYILMAA